LLKFTPEECYDKVLNEEFKKKLFCKMKNVITRIISYNFVLYVMYITPHLYVVKDY
jgi:hypothetical protein